MSGITKLAGSDLHNLGHSPHEVKADFTQPNCGEEQQLNQAAARIVLYIGRGFDHLIHKLVKDGQQPKREDWNFYLDFIVIVIFSFP